MKSYAMFGYGSQAFPGKGVVKPEQAEIDRRKREVAKLKMDIQLTIDSASCSNATRAVGNKMPGPRTVHSRLGENRQRAR